MTVGEPARFRGIFRRDAAARAVYSETAGIQRIDPLAVAVPADVEDLAALVEWARSDQVVLIPRGSGSSMSGGAIGRGVIVDLSRWRDIGRLSETEPRITVGPGVICAALGEAVRPASLRFAVNPSSAGFCTIGGMTATNAAGAHSLAFGSMREWVAGIEVLLPDGTHTWVRRGEVIPASPRLAAIASRLNARRGESAFSAASHRGVRKDSSGYATASFSGSGDLVDLLVGSEGTLAFFTSIELQLMPVAGACASVMGIFPSLDAATEAAMLARDAGAVACELLDKTFLDLVAAASGNAFAPGTEAILLADVEGSTPAAAAAGAGTVGRGFVAAGAADTRIATSAEEREALWELRHAASPTLARLSAELKSMQVIEDGAVPPDRLGDYVAGVRAALTRQKIRGVIFGHAGDAHVHVNALVDVTAADWRARLEGLLGEVTALVASLGGTISGEHGDGRLRTPLLSQVWDGPSLDGFSLVKKTFDPDGLLNPGVKIGGDGVIGPIKYDPKLPSLPPEAARVLADVERSRGYGAFRLDLLPPDAPR